MTSTSALPPDTFDLPVLTAYLERFAGNVFTLFLLVWAAYKPNRYHREAVFTFCAFNLLIFFLCNLLLNRDIGLEFAFGLFAIFSILRYRTAAVSMRDMTYLFAAICIGLINSMEIGFQLLIWVSDLMLIGVLVLLERLFLREGISSMTVIFENISLVKGERSEPLRQAISERTGIEVIDYKILNISYLEDTARIRIFFSRTQDLPDAPSVMDIA